MFALAVEHGLLTRRPRKGPSGWERQSVPTPRLTVWSDPAAIPVIDEDAGRRLWVLAEARLEPTGPAADGSLWGADAASAILVRYSRGGLEALGELRGDFAYVLWDGATQRLIAGRDPLGVQGLYKASERGVLWLGSEPTPVARCLRRRVLNLEEAAAVLVGQYSRSGATLYEGVRAVDPGCMLIATVGGVEQRRYWRPRVAASNRGRVEDWTENVRNSVTVAVKRRMPSGNLPVAVLVSSGLDSASVARLAVDAVGADRVVLLNMTTPGFECDEGPAVRELARYLGVKLVQLGLLDATAGQPPVPDVLHTLLGHALPRLVGSESVRGAVLLTGDAGDELFGTAGAVRPPGRWPRGAIDQARWLRRWIRGRRNSPARLLTKEARAMLPRGCTTEGAFSSHGRRAAADLSAFLGEDRRWVELQAERRRVARSNGLHWFSLPFLDDAVVDLSSRMPPELRRVGGLDKFLLRRAMAGRLPDSILAAPKRSGFKAPIKMDFWRNREEVREAIAILGQLGLVDERHASAALGPELPYSVLGAYAGMVDLARWIRYHLQ